MAKLLRLSLATLTFLVFFYSTTLANELPLSAGLGTHRILAPIGQFLMRVVGKVETHASRQTVGSRSHIDAGNVCAPCA